VTTPLATDPAPRVTPADPPGSLRILLVDGSRRRLDAWRGVLENAFPGCRVETARRGHDAWTLLRTRPFDALLAEGALEDMSGLELMRRASAERPGTVRILLAAPGHAESGEEAILHGRIHGFLATDIPLADAAPTLRRIWDGQARGRR